MVILQLFLFCFFLQPGGVGSVDNIYKIFACRAMCLLIYRSVL